MKNIKVTGIKKAIGEWRDWTSRSRSYAANIMLDRSTGEVWTDCFTNTESWKEYRDPDVISLLAYMSDRMVEKVNMYSLKEYAKKAICEYQLKGGC